MTPLMAPDMIEDLARELRKGKIPAHCREGLFAYLTEGRPVGDFLTAVLENNLTRAVTSADGYNILAIPHYVHLLLDCAPGNAWGSPAAVVAWIEKGRAALTADAGAPSDWLGIALATQGLADLRPVADELLTAMRERRPGLETTGAHLQFAEAERRMQQFATARPIEPHSDKRYLGDGAFVMPGSWAGEIVLTTENGIEETNRVVLDASSFHMLADWVRERGQRLP